jgi:outer membrane immunogenic protein
MLRRIALASAALAASGALAPALAQPTSAWNWTGPYVGLNAGYAGGQYTDRFYGTTDLAGTNPVSGQLRQTSSGPLGGAQIGYNVQGYDGLLFGIETDIDAANIRGRTDFYSLDGAGTYTSGGVDSQIQYLGTVRGRIGAPLLEGRFVPYVTGGFAYGGVKNTAGFGCSTCASGGGFSTNVQTQTGWTVGAGAEYALDRHLSFRVEYLYADLGRTNLSSSGFGGGISLPGVGLYNASVSEQADANLIRAGVNFRF